MTLGKANQPTEAEIHMALGFNSSPQAAMSETWKTVDVLWYLLVITQLDSLPKANGRLEPYCLNGLRKSVPLLETGWERSFLEIWNLLFPVAALQNGRISSVNDLCLLLHSDLLALISIQSAVGHAP